MITQKQVRERFLYFPFEGVLLNRINNGSRAKKGGVVGTGYGQGYKRAEINRKRYMIHRIIWMYVHGYSPEHSIDHINMVKDDNRLHNLRVVTQSCNLRNTRLQKNNTSGLKGVRRERGTWRSVVWNNGKDTYIGSFKTPIEASKARIAYMELHPDIFSCDAVKRDREVLKLYMETRP